MGRFNQDKIIIAFDFDGTLVVDKMNFKNPHLNDGAALFIKFLSKFEGVRFILWTCRTGELLDKAKEFLKEHDLFQHFASFNEPMPEDAAAFTCSNKLYADYYVDDLSISWEGPHWTRFILVLSSDLYFVSRGVDLTAEWAEYLASSC